MSLGTYLHCLRQKGDQEDSNRGLIVQSLNEFIVFLKDSQNKEASTLKVSLVVFVVYSQISHNLILD